MADRGIVGPSVSLVNRRNIAMLRLNQTRFKAIVEGDLMMWSRQLSNRLMTTDRVVSMANAAIDTVVSLVNMTPADDCASVGVTSIGEYGVPQGLTFGLPILADGKGSWSVKEGFALDDFANERIKITTDELLSERDEVRSLGLI